MSTQDMHLAAAIEQLRGAALHIKSAVESLEAMAGKGNPCPHRNRQDVSMMGKKAKTYRCKDCEFEWTVPLVEGGRS